MISHVAGRGHSFSGAGQYYLHDKQASTTERVEWTYTHNIPTNDPEKALKWMAWTDMHAEVLKAQAGVSNTGRKATAGSVYAFSLSWHPEKEQEPDRQGKLDAALETLERLGLTEHEAVIVAHNDTAHPHVHVICNMVHPETGRTAVASYDFLKFSDWAEEHERQHNQGEVICEQRAKNNAGRRDGEYVKHREEKLERARLVEQLYTTSDSGRAFQAALEENGYTLAKGNRRGYVLVAEDGTVHSLSRQLKEQRAADIKARLSDLNQETMPSGKDLSEERQHFDRDQYESERLQQIVDAAIEEEKQRGEQQDGRGETSSGGPKPEVDMPGQDKDVTGRFDDASGAAKQKQEERDRVDPFNKGWFSTEGKRQEALQNERDKDIPGQFNEASEGWQPDDGSHLRDLDNQREREGREERQRQRQEAALEAFYEPEETAEELARLKVELAKYQGFRGRVTGRRAELEEEIEAQQKNLENIEMCMAEQRGTLEARLARERSQERSPERSQERSQDQATDAGPANENEPQDDEAAELAKFKAQLQVRRRQQQQQRDRGPSR